MIKTMPYTILLIFLLSLATWIFFYWWYKQPLKAEETMVVVGFWGIVTIIGRKIWQRFNAKDKE